MSDQVEHPTHYNHLLRKECWTEMAERYGWHAVVCFDVLSAYKYIYRAGTKPGQSCDTDLSKAVNYLKHARKIATLKLTGGEQEEALRNIKATVNILEEMM